MTIPNKSKSKFAQKPVSVGFICRHLIEKQKSILLQTIDKNKTSIRLCEKKAKNNTPLECQCKLSQS